MSGQRVRQGLVDACSAIERRPACSFVQPLRGVVLFDEVSVRLPLGIEGYRQGQRSPLFPTPTLATILSTVRREQSTL